MIPGYAGPEPGNPPVLVRQGIDTNFTNQSFDGGAEVARFTVTPTPIDLFRAELDVETLPGPRYMAFGPSVIGISVDPRFLAVCFAVVLIALVIWFVSFRNRDDEREE
ncbi:hypothetical protein [Methanoregula sp.]|uniref:hypothetical protein n=1 Tax=Methanoregula sp. TaxID=2052170 RepID=UPI002639F816|nr:hypothetical protein [Methanoregula sp.]MDD5143037.1 hypothetical protein [Methanoregula sp.]